MPFYHYSQNNSGGGFDFSEAHGITAHVIIEAANADEAAVRAEQIGLYFDGAGDCACCGNRWGTAWGEGDPVPMVYGKPLGVSAAYSYAWMPPGRETAVHYLDGRIEWFTAEGERA